uniref:Rab proteins geranylgeranyltransferase component A n=1 Tax=Dendroctonus ponderosae TaxID=77166 RepID=J3JU15_DENPD|nr:unknown [Dendroctonus ponderosae]
MNDQLPSEFDLVIVGTGMIESIISAAASRIGKTVLHIDSNDYYGGLWASFNLEGLHNYAPKSPETSQGGCPALNHLPIGNAVSHIGHFESNWHVPEKLEPPETDIEGDLEQMNLEESRGKEHSQESLLKISRKFNIDLVPKLHYARGSFVELLISSNIARYAEYRSVSRVLTWLKGQLEPVPCSRADVFSSKNVSVIEKRLLMKLLTSLDRDLDADDDKPDTFLQFLQARKIPPNLVHFVLYAMARGSKETSLDEGISNTKRFLGSLGRFGKTPFLFSMYGSGETPQAFCRLSAVFGGVFALNQPSLSGLKLENHKVEALLNGDQEIKAQHFVLGAEHSPSQFLASVANGNQISRAVFVTDKSLIPSEQEHLTLLVYPPDDKKPLATIVEMGHLTGTCPKGFYLLHMTTKLVSSPKEDLQHIVSNLLGGNEEDGKPKILWSCYFSLPEAAQQQQMQDLPENVFLCSGPNLDLDYDAAIHNAKGIFEKMYPGLDFLPRAPDPDEIIIGGEEEVTETMTDEDTKEPTMNS